MPTTNLSHRARFYLSTLERVDTITDKETMGRIFDDAGVELFEPLISFQQQFGGYLLSSIVEPLKFDLYSLKDKGSLRLCTLNDF